jgi:hypothetical protein
MVWESLNERQQEYMKAIYQIDQQQEAYEKQRAARNWHSRPADEWRWIEYADSVLGYTPLKRLIVEKDLVDHGTGSTFDALERRDLILVRYERSPHLPRYATPYIRLTTKGRKLVRQALGLQSPRSLPTGTLREWHWRALCRAWVAWENGEKGIHSDEDTGDGFGYVSWNTILRLRDYRIKGEDKSLIRDGWLTITPFGQQYYKENWEMYREMYPEVNAPKPE